MRVGLLAAFLVSHGLVHLAIWLPHPDPKADRPLPFQPDHSALLSAVAAPETGIQRIAVLGAVGVTLGFVLAAGVIVAGASVAATVTAVAASLGLVQKAVFFHPWLSVGVLIDAGVLTVALTGWPIGL